MCSPSWTLLPPPSPYPPSGSSQCTSPKHPVSCIEPGLATRFIYDIIHVSMPFSQISPPSPSPTHPWTSYLWQKRHRCVEQSFGLCGRGRGWDDLGEWNWNMYIIICETDRQFQVQCMRQGGQGWCTGMTHRNGMGREVGGGFRMGSTCTPVADSCRCMAKPIQYCKVISLQLK